MKALFLLFFSLASLLTGCATAFHNPDEHVFLVPDDPSDLEGAVIWVNGKPSLVETLHLQLLSKEDWGTFKASTNMNPYVTGPGVARIKLKRSAFESDYALVVRKDGFKDQKFHLNRNISGLFFGNIFNGIGFLVDLYSGFAWEYTPKYLELKFVADKS